MLLKADPSQPLEDQLFACSIIWKSRGMPKHLLLAREDLAIVERWLSGEGSARTLSDDLAKYLRESFRAAGVAVPARLAPADAPRPAAPPLASAPKGSVEPAPSASRSAAVSAGSSRDASRSVIGKEGSFEDAVRRTSPRSDDSPYDRHLSRFPEPVRPAAARASPAPALAPDSMSEEAMAAQWRAAASHRDGAHPLATDVSVFAPPAIRRGKPVLVQVMLHTAEQSQAAGERASLVDSAAGLRGTSALTVDIKPGARVTIMLIEPGLKIDQPVHSVVWRGKLTSVHVVVELPWEGQKSDLFPRVQVSIGPAVIGELRFKIEVQDVFAPEKSTSLRPAEAKRYQRAFFSYSSKDRQRVMEIAQAYKIAGVEFFQDILSLEPGARWEKGLYKQIDDCDLFVLFWSEAARTSEWVGKEWRYALDRQRAGSALDIVPLILEGPPAPQPPRDLSHLHFDDWMRYAMAALQPSPQPDKGGQGGVLWTVLTIAVVALLLAALWAWR